MLTEASNGESTDASLPSDLSSRVSYEIRLREHLDPCWWHRFEGWSFVDLSNGECLLSAHVDQSGLHGALNKIRDLNLTVLSVTRL
jgi:hypothetical protein